MASEGNDGSSFAAHSLLLPRPRLPCPGRLCHPFLAPHGPLEPLSRRLMAILSGIEELAACSGQAVVVLRQDSTAGLRRVATAAAPSERHLALAWNHSARVLACTGSSGRLRFYDADLGLIEGGDLPADVSARLLTGPISHLAFTRGSEQASSRPSSRGPPIPTLAPPTPPYATLSRAMPRQPLVPSGSYCGRGFALRGVVQPPNKAHRRSA